MTIQGQAFEAVGPAETRVFLPPAISFLAFHGVHLATLWEAGRIAERCGVDADVALLRSGLVKEEFFYRALAHEMRLPYVAGPEIAVHAEARLAESVRSGAVRLVESEGGPAWAQAPSGETLLTLLGARNRNLSGLAIASPTGLREAVLARHGPSLAEDAAEGLRRRDPDLCFCGGLTRRQQAGLAVVALIVAAAFAWSMAGALMAVSLVLSVPFFALAALRIRATATVIGIAPGKRPERLPDAALPVYTIIVPLYREARVLPRLTAALAAFDYPAAKLDIKLVVEEDDAQMRDALEGASLPGSFEVLRAPAGQPRTKPRALNIALPLARGAFTVVYDAEDVPDPGQLRLAVATFATAKADVACLQARLAIDNTGDSLLTALFTIEYAALFDVINPALADLGCPVPLGGTSNHFRTAVLTEIGGWDAYNVTEDADLGMRLALGGYQVGDLPSSTFEEAPARLRPWLHQRSRWMKGFVQVCITHSRHPVTAWRRLGTRKTVHAVAVTFGTVLSTLGFPLFLGLALYALLAGDLLSPQGPLDFAASFLGITLFVAGLVSMIAPAIDGVRRRGWHSLLPYVALMPFYYVLVSAAAWRGLLDLVRNPSRWNKTEHGLALTSRAGLIGKPAPSPLLGLAAGLDRAPQR